MNKLEQKSRLSGHFMIEKHKVGPDGNEIPGSRKVVAPWQDNMVVDSGLDNMASAGFMARCGVGAGNTAPGAGDTELVSPLASVNGTVEAGPVGDGFVSIVGTYVFGQGVATGIIAEVCVRPTSGNITTRALIEDENGDPTTIAKGPMDVLTVTYQMREYPDQTDTVSQVVNPHTSVEYTVTSRTVDGAAPARLISWHAAGPARPFGNQGATRASLASLPLVGWDEPNPSQGRVGNNGSSISTYSPGDCYLDLEFLVPEGEGNVSGGITYLSIGNPQASATLTQPLFLQASFDPPIDKDHTKTLTITLRKSWGRL